MITAIVILNWNGKEFLERFLPGLLSSVNQDPSVPSEAPDQVIIADNASTDGSLEMLGDKFPGVKVLSFTQNYGFTGGYNKALSEIEADYFVLINSDIEVTDGWLYPLTEWMDLHEDCAACAPKLLSWYQRDTFEYAGAAGGWIDYYGYPFCRGRVLKMVETDEGQYDLPADVLWATGACLMVRASVWKELNGLDERFFAHMEEIDFCWRCRLNGWKVNVVPRSVVYHLGGGTLPNDSPWKLFLNYRNNLLMLSNNLAKTFALECIYAVTSLNAEELEDCADDISNCINVYEDLPDYLRSKLIRSCAKGGRRMAGRRIFVRKCLDGLSAMVYLFTGKWSYVQSVWKAHRDFKKLKITESTDNLTQWLEQQMNSSDGGAARTMLDIDIHAEKTDKVSIRGMLDESIILLSKAYGNGVFDYLREKIKG